MKTYSKAALQFYSKNMNFLIRNHKIEDKKAIMDFYENNHPDAYCTLFKISHQNHRDTCSRVFDHSLKYNLGNTTIDTDKNQIAFGFMGTDFYHNLGDNYKEDFCVFPNASNELIEFMQQLNTKIPTKYLPSKFGEVCGADGCVNPIYTRLGLFKKSFIYFLQQIKERNYKYFITRNVTKGSQVLAARSGAIKVGYINLTEFKTSKGLQPFKDAEKLYNGQPFDNEVDVCVLDVENLDLDYLEKHL